jgi:transcriptional regulator with XRE-family HTH domain
MKRGVSQCSPDVRCFCDAVNRMERIAEAPFWEELPRLLRERSMSQRALAAQVGVSPSHLSRVLRRADYKTPGVTLMTRIAESLDLPNDYFIELRESAVIERVKRDPAFRERVYALLRGVR